MIFFLNQISTFSKLYRRVIRQWNDNFNTSQANYKKNLKNVSRKYKFHFSGKWEIKMSEFGAVWDGPGVCNSTCLYEPLLITSRQLHKPNYLQKFPETFPAPHV